MGQSSSLRRLLESRLEDCCDADVDERLGELESLADAVPTDPSADLDALSTLGNGTRYRIASLLVAADDELCVCELSPLVDVSDSAISHALSDLADAGLVARRKDGTWRYYRPTERAARLLAALDATRGDRVTDPRDATAEDAVRLAFVCVQNAGRSQMATAFAERERDRRGLDDVELLTGGTHPADAIHEVVVEAMAEANVDLSDRAPRELSTAELETCDVVATMGCSTLELDADVDVRDWALDDPHGRDIETVREIRATIEGRVEELFDELEATADV